MIDYASITDDMAAQKKAEIIERAEEFDCEIAFLDDLDKALVGTHIKPDGQVVAVYDRGLCLECLADGFSKDCAEDDDPYEMAIEWFQYNVERSLPYLHEKAPIIIESI